METISKEHIRTHVHAEDWTDAIVKAGDLLAATGDITPDYIKGMISSVETLGPYIVIAPSFALAHTAPGPSVKRTSISLITLDTPVRFNSPNDPVSIVMCLACTDKTSHIDKLSQIARLMMRPGMIERIRNCADEEALYSLVNTSGKEV